MQEYPFPFPLPPILPSICWRLLQPEITVQTVPGCNFRHLFHKSPALRCIRAGQAFGFVDQLQELTAVAEGIASFGVAGELTDHFPS